MNQTSFLDKCKGIALIFSAVGLMLFGAAALVYSASPAQADTAPLTTYSTGKYQLDFQTAPLDDVIHLYILVSDTETGRSKLYYGNNKKGFSVANDAYQLPSSPL